MKRLYYTNCYAFGRHVQSTHGTALLSATHGAMSGALLRRARRLDERVSFHDAFCSVPCAIGLCSGGPNMFRVSGYERG